MLTLSMETVSEILMVSVVELDMAGTEVETKKKKKTKEKREEAAKEIFFFVFRFRRIVALIPYYGKLNLHYTQ